MSTRKGYRVRKERLWARGDGQYVMRDEGRGKTKTKVKGKRQKPPCLPKAIPDVGAGFKPARDIE